MVCGACSFTADDGGKTRYKDPEEVRDGLSGRSAFMSVFRDGRVVSVSFLPLGPTYYIALYLAERLTCRPNTQMNNMFEPRECFMSVVDGTSVPSGSQRLELGRGERVLQVIRRPNTVS